MPRPIYRVRQVVHALRPRLDDEGLALARELLPGTTGSLFFAMERRDQRHAIEVTRRLLEAGVDDHDLLAAALLHDSGKGAVPVWLRVAKVLSPGLVRRFGAADGPGWRGSAHRLAHHPEIGAAQAAAAGASPATVRLISGRVEAGEASRLAQLQTADDAS